MEIINTQTTTAEIYHFDMYYVVYSSVEFLDAASALNTSLTANLDFVLIG